MKVRTRFAPSPTGYLHIGGARTALFSWLYARHVGGEFVLRIEDTDAKRSTKDSSDSVLEALNWLGITSDKEIVFQSDRLSRYQEVARLMLDSGAAYYCECSKDRLDNLREKQLLAKEKPKYDNRCRDMSLKQSSNTVIRFRNPLVNKVNFQDEVYGEVSFDNQELDDFIVMRSDGLPTYNFAAPIDDYDMGITNIIRGDDHLNNTPKQINLLKSLGFDVPIYAHLPMILSADGKKMSKRHDEVDVLSFKRKGIISKALLNYLVRLGWSHGDQEIFSIKEMVELFAVENVNKAPATFDIDKLLWINKTYIKDYENNIYIKELKDIYDSLGVDISNIDQTLPSILKLFASRADNLVDLATSSAFLYVDDVEISEDAVNSHVTENTVEYLKIVIHELTEIQEWEAENISICLKKLIKKLGVKFPVIAQPIRIALTGGVSSPGVDGIIALLGKQKALLRLERLVNKLS